MTPGELRTARLELGFTQARLAEYMGVDPMTISRWERGVTKPSPYLHVVIDSIRKSAKRKRR